MAPFDRLYMTFNWSAIAVFKLYLAPLSSYLTLTNIVTLKSGLEVSRGHSKWYHSKALVCFPIHIL